MIAKNIQYFGRECVLACDAGCNKAFGINSRPREQLSDNEDDYAFLADSEVGVAPQDPGTYEGGYGKPMGQHDRLNKWCARECERSVRADKGEDVKLKDFSQRVYNLKSRQNECAL